MNRQLTLCLLVVMLPCIISCSSKGTVEKASSSDVKAPASDVHTATKLNKQEVAAIAEDEMRRQGINIDAYESPQISYPKDGKGWWIWFKSKSKIPGGSFGFSINDETKKCTSFVVE